MSSNKTDVSLEPNYVDFVGSDEYDIVSNLDLVLASEKDSQSSPGQKQQFGDSFSDKSFSTFKQYEEEWNKLYRSKEIDINGLRQKSIEGHLRTSHFRSICWRCLLGILHKKPKEWICQLQTYRKHYDEVCTELEQNPWTVKGNNPYDNPLSQESDSIWQKYFCDEELKSVVHQDVKRTFPDMNFFKKEEIQKMMVRILFCYARQNPALCYRQGMHEILAPLIFILHCDHQAFLHAREQNLFIDKDIYEILNPDNLEQDAFSIFKLIMDNIECSYRINNVITTSAGQFPSDSEKFENKSSQNEAISRLEIIKKTILRPKDPELSEHLEKLDIPLHLFGIRWLRLLFGREFPLQDLLVLWDFIFANNFETVNYIVVSMLIAIRHILLNGDYTDCLSNLMRYPNGVDVTYVIDYALHLKDPQKHTAPNYMQIPSLPKSVKHESCQKQNIETCNIISQNNRRLKTGSSKPPQWLLGKSNQFFLGPSGDGDSAVVCGYSIDDPNLLKIELEQTKILINVVQNKLLQFHKTLSENLQSSSNSEIQIVVDGIYELSRLLKNHCKETNCEIETASEAGETKESKFQKPSSSAIMPLTDQPKTISASTTSERRTHTFPKTKKGIKSGELKVFKQHMGGTISGVPMTDPLRLIKNLAEDECFR